jgi:hypothetical protein
MARRLAEKPAEGDSAADPQQFSESDVLKKLAGPSADDRLRRQLLEERIEGRDHVATLVRDELPAVANRLLGTDPELYAAYDRTRAEAEFRAATSLPVAAVLIALAGAQSAWWLSALPLPVLLFAQAVRRLRAAGDLLAEALRAGRKIEAPVLDEVVTKEIAAADQGLWWEDPESVHVQAAYDRGRGRLSTAGQTHIDLGRSSVACYFPRCGESAVHDTCVARAPATDRRCQRRTNP